MREERASEATTDDETLRMTTDIVASYVSNNKLDRDQLSELIRAVHKAMSTLARGDETRLQDRPKPAVPINRSIHPDYLVCLEDGKKLIMLKRHLRSTYSMSPDEYRKRWGLPADYPMVAPSYAAQRSEHAKKIGLGKGVRRKEG